VSSAILFDKANPRNPINRRISIIVMTKKAEKAALQGYEREQPGAAVGRAAPTSPAATVTRSATP
jgi:chemotaxis protein MotB